MSAKYAAGGATLSISLLSYSHRTKQLYSIYNMHFFNYGTIMCSHLIPKT